MISGTLWIGTRCFEYFKDCYTVYTEWCKKVVIQRVGAHNSLKLLFLTGWDKKKSDVVAHLSCCDAFLITMMVKSDYMSNLVIFDSLN